MTSPVPELIVPDSLCKGLFKTISESVESSSHTDPELVTSENYSGDVIGQLLEQMKQILPPEERDVIGDGEEISIEDILEEANELIQATTPLFSSSESGEKSWNKSSKTVSKSLKKNDVKDYNDKIINKDTEKSDNDSICSSAESFLEKENIYSTKLPDEVERSLNNGNDNVDYMDICRQNVDKEREVDIHIIEEQPHESLKNTNDDLKMLSCIKNNMETFIRSSTENISDISLNQLKSEQVNQTSFDKITEANSEILVKDKLFKAKANEQLELKIQLDQVKQKYMVEIEELKQFHNKEVHELTEQLSRCNIKIYELQKSFKVEKSPDVKVQQLDHLRSEIKSQEHLITGYERENKKLCKEISTLKVAWEQKEAKLIEEKQKLQNHLQGMVSKSATKAMEEQLKDAQETIVKLQMELTTYKSKSKELEMTCERLRGETHRLQTELNKCHCQQYVGRRDKYNFLSNSVSAQVQELKNIISRKDMEIAQMNTTLGILNGELGSKEGSQQLESYSFTISHLQTALAVEQQAVKDLVNEKETLLKDNLDLKRQVRELETIVKRRQRTDSCFPVTVGETQSSSRLLELEKELSSRQESLSELHSQFMNMQKKYEDHIQDLEEKLRECRKEINTLKANLKKEETSQLKLNARKSKQGTAIVKEETHLLATIRGLRHEALMREKEITKLSKEIEEVRLTNKRLQKEREKQLNSIPVKMSQIKEKAMLRKMDKPSSAVESRSNLTSPNNNVNPLLISELQESNLILELKTKSLQEEVARLEQDLIAMHNKRVHDLNVLQKEHELEMARLLEGKTAFLTDSSNSELQGQVYTQQMVITHLKNRLKQMEELKNEVTLLRAERDHLEESLDAVNQKMSYLQNAQSPDSNQYKTLLAKLEALEKNQEIREQKLNTVRELLSRSTQGQGQCSGTCRDKLLDKNRQICYYRAQMDRILEALLELRRTK